MSTTHLRSTGQKRRQSPHGIQLPDGDLRETENGALAQRILVAFKQAGITTSNRQIANALNCSPTTVGTWKTRFQREGLLPSDSPLGGAQLSHLVETSNE